MTQDNDTSPQHGEEGHVHYILIQLEENPLKPEEAVFNVNIENISKEMTVTILRDLANQIEAEAAADEAEVEDLAVSIPSLDELQ